MACICYIHTLESGINIAVRLLIFAKFSRGLCLFKGLRLFQTLEYLNYEGLNLLPPSQWLLHQVCKFHGLLQGGRFEYFPFDLESGPYKNIFLQLFLEQWSLQVSLGNRQMLLQGKFHSCFCQMGNSYSLSYNCLLLRLEQRLWRRQKMIQKNSGVSLSRETKPEWHNSPF